MSLYETLRRAIAMVLAVSMMLAVLPAAAAEEAVVQPLGLTEGEPVPQPLDPEGEPVVLPLGPESEPVILPLDPEGEPVILPTDPDDGAVVLPDGPDDDTGLPTEGGTLVITWPDPDDTDEPDEPESDDPANIPVTLPLFPDEELDGEAAEGVCKDLITEVEETGTEVIRWPEPDEAETQESRKANHIRSCLFDITVEYVPATCEEGAYTLKQCSRTNYKGEACPETTRVYDLENLALGHAYKLVPTKAATCAEDGVGTETCKNCGKENGTKTIPALGGSCTPEEKLDPPTCTEDGSKYMECTKCHHQTDVVTLNNLGGHDLDDGTLEQPYACLPGKIVRNCKRENCGHSENEPVEATAEHTPGAWQDQDLPGCCVQEFKTNCTVCGTAMLKTSDALREHKFSTVASHKGTVLFVEVEIVDGFKCDYCGMIQSAGTADSSIALGVEKGATALANEATGVIHDVLNKTMTDINNAETREDAIKALEGLHGNLVKELKDKVKTEIAGQQIGLTTEMAELLLESLGITGVLEQVTEGADESFLSKESLQATVSKVVETVVSEDGTAVTKECVHDVLFSELFGLIGRDDLAPTYDTATDKLILQLAQTATADDAYWDELTRSLIDDLLDEALKELRSDKTAGSVGSSVSEALKKALPDSLGPVVVWRYDGRCCFGCVQGVPER